MLALKLMHVLTLVYWLGGDLGTFYSSVFVINPSLTPAQRGTALKIMMGTDLAPRLCMPLTLATGVNLAIGLGYLPLPGIVVAFVWVMCLAWITMVLVVHHAADRAKVERVIKFDFAFRLLLSVSLGLVALSGLLHLLPLLAPWLGLKLLCFALTVACGLMIRVYLQPFGPAFARVMQRGPDPADDAIIASSIHRCRPYVIFIWVLLVIAAATGIHWITP
jgi:hypothetical protein